MISIFTTITKPAIRGDNYSEAFKCYRDLADEVVIVYGAGNFKDGHIRNDISENTQIKELYYNWPKEFSWDFIGQQFQRGYEACTGDWVLHMDIDFLFHERDFGAIRQALKDYPDAPAVSFYKYQFILPDRYNLKSRLVLAVNKAKFGDRIKFNGGGDLCQPTLDGQDLNLNEIPQSGIPFYNYEKLSKTRQQIYDDVSRMDRAYHRHFKRWLYSEDGRNPYKGWLRMVSGRFTKPSKHINLEDHPKYIQETIRNLRPDQWGFNGLGNLEDNDYVKSLMRG